MNSFVSQSRFWCAVESGFVAVLGLFLSGIVCALPAAAESAFAGTGSVRSTHAADGRVVVRTDEPAGPVKPVNGVNGAPHLLGTPAFVSWRNLEIPYGRTHDFGLIPSYGGTRSVDVLSIFRDFDADADDPANYDFAETDKVLSRLRAAGTEPFYRLGAEYEGWLAKRYTIHAPSDPLKWARICEHIVAHYNEGWANGHRWNVRYWEIWNEPDLQTENGTNGLFWVGSRASFKTLFKTSLVHLKSRFPGLRFGGAAFSSPVSAWAEEILKEFAAEGVPLDFYSWHAYSSRPETFVANAKSVRALLDRHGFTATESICDEWNYVKGWNSWDQLYSFEVERGVDARKGAAFLAASLNAFQSSATDKAMLYDASTFALMNTLFRNPSGYPLPGAYAFYAWAKLRRLGESVRATSSLADVSVTAARSPDGRWGLLVARYDEDNNVTRPVRVALAGVPLAKARCHLTDDWRVFTETPLECGADGSPELELRPCSFAFVDW